MIYVATNSWTNTCLFYFIATTRGGRIVPTGTTKRRSSHGGTRNRQPTINRHDSQYPGATTTANDVQVAMMPDLSENLTDEERIWEEIHEIKSMPVPMAQKKELKAQLQVSLLAFI